MKQSEQFVQGYVEMHTAEQVKQQKELIKEQMKGQPIPKKDESFWAKKWMNGAKNQLKDFKVPDIAIPKLPPMPSANNKQPNIIQEAPAMLDIEHEVAPPKVEPMMEPIDEQLIESTPPSSKNEDSNPYHQDSNPYHEE
mgnify:FL=1